MRPCPQSQEECEQKRKTPKEKEGDVKRTTSGFQKRGQKKKPEKTEKPSAAQPQGHFWQRPQIREKKRHGRAPPARAKFARAADTLRKMAFSKRARFCSPKGFFALETQFRQNFEHRTVQNSNPRKKLSSRRVHKILPCRHAQRARRCRKPRHRSEIPCFVAFRVSPTLRLCCQKTEDQSGERRASRKGGQKNAPKASKMAILRKGRFRDFLVIADFPRKPVTPFRTIKQAVSEDPDSLLTLPGPLINS